MAPGRMLFIQRAILQNKSIYHFHPSCCWMRIYSFKSSEFWIKTSTTEAERENNNIHRLIKQLEDPRTHICCWAPADLIPSVHSGRTLQCFDSLQMKILVSFSHFLVIFILLRLVSVDEKPLMCEKQKKKR